METAISRGVCLFCQPKRDFPPPTTHPRMTRASAARRTMSRTVSSAPAPSSDRAIGRLPRRTAQCSSVHCDRTSLHPAPHTRGWRQLGGAPPTAPVTRKRHSSGAAAPLNATTLDRDASRAALAPPNSPFQATSRRRQRARCHRQGAYQRRHRRFGQSQATGDPRETSSSARDAPSCSKPRHPHNLSHVTGHVSTETPH